MNQKRRIFLSVLAAVNFAFALTLPSQAEPIQVDRGRIYEDIVREKTRDEKLPQVEAGLSTWRPRDPAYTGFENQSAPQVGLRFLVPVTHSMGTAWNGVAGFSYLGLSRSEPILLTSGARVTDERQISILQVPLGFEAAPKALAIGHLSAFTEIGALPTLFVFGHSLEEDGHSNSGVGAFGDLGALYRFGGPNFDVFSLVATVGYRIRLTGDVDTKGFAALFGVRVGI